MLACLSGVGSPWVIAVVSNKIVGVMGSGMIGTDPYAQNAWSGSSKFFFRECQRQGLLERAFGVEVPAAAKLSLMARNFSIDRGRWRRKFYLDTTYYDLLARQIAARLTPSERDCTVLQIGGIYDLRPLLGPQRLMVSYHDGNLAQAMRSPQFLKQVSQRRLQRAFDYERRVYHGLDLIFTMSEYLRRSFIEDFGVAEQRVRNIGAGINLDVLPMPPQNRRYDTKQLLFIGADFERKGGPDLLRAFKQVRVAHPSAQLYIVGPRQLSIPNELAAGVVYVGFLSKGDPAQRARLEQIIAESSLFVMPSHYEPFGIAPLEAMAHEIGAVLTRAWAFTEMVKPGVNGELVEIGGVDELAQKLITLLGNPEQLRSYGVAGRKMVLERYTWEAVVRKAAAELSAVQTTMARTTAKAS